MELLVVRHAHAGSREGWHGDDRLRPLSDRGRAEALALVPTLSAHEPHRIVSSPLVRCLETVEPVASCLSLAVEASDRLGPDADRGAAELVRELLADMAQEMARGNDAGAVVICTHGETIEALQRRLPRSAKLGFGPGGAHEKGSVWVLRARGGRFVSARYLPPGGSRTGSPIGSAGDSVRGGPLGPGDFLDEEV